MVLCACTNRTWITVQKITSSIARSKIRKVAKAVCISKASTDCRRSRLSEAPRLASDGAAEERSRLMSNLEGAQSHSTQDCLSPRTESTSYRGRQLRLINL